MPGILGDELSELTDRRRILVIDADLDSGRSLAVLLSIMGHDARVATTRSEALACADGLCPDLIVTEIDVPDLDLDEVTARVRAAGVAPYVAVVTAWIWRAFNFTVMADEYLLKPASLRELAAVIARSRRADELR